jgi:hypothetical protein
VARCHIDGGQEDGLTACLAGTLNDFVAILRKLLAIEMAVGIDECTI